MMRYTCKGNIYTILAVNISEILQESFRFRQNSDHQ